MSQRDCYLNTQRGGALVALEGRSQFLVYYFLLGALLSSGLKVT